MSNKIKVEVCFGKSCGRDYAKYIGQRILNEQKYDSSKLDELPLETELDLKEISFCKKNCMGRCKEGPNVKIDNDFFTRCTPVSVWNSISKKKQSLDKEN